jgi:hypothetical protein
MAKAKYTPCIKVCTHNKDGYCIGCGRTQEEVRTWKFRSEEEQLEGIKMLKERKKGIRP